VCDLETSRICAPYIYIKDISSLRVNRGNFNSKSNTVKVIDNGDPRDAMGGYIKHN